MAIMIFLWAPLSEATQRLTHFTEWISSIEDIYRDLSSLRGNGDGTVYLCNQLRLLIIKRWRLLQPFEVFQIVFDPELGFVCCNERLNFFHGL